MLSSYGGSTDKQLFLTKKRREFLLTPSMKDKRIILKYIL